MTYDFLRYLADSWGLVAMLAFFAGVAAFAFRPGSREYYGRAAQIPFQNSSED